MVTNWCRHCLILAGLVMATALLGACSPPLPKTQLRPSAGSISSDRQPAIAATSLEPR